MNIYFELEFYLVEQPGKALIPKADRFQTTVSAIG